MGRTSKWLRSLLGGKKESKQHHPGPPLAAPIPPSKEITVDESKKAPKEKRRWSFRRSLKDHASDTVPTSTEPRNSSLECHISETEKEQSKHAIAVAAATAAAADAAVAAAQAAAAVVRLTNNVCTLSHGGLNIEEWAATRIQSTFRGYLARRALRALKGLVKLQALVRGHMVRKQAAATLHCMQALIRVQARVRARRVRMSEEGQAVQRRLLQRRQQETHPRKSSDGWNASTYSIEKQEAEAQSRQAAVMKRERALAYAISQQLDHWMAACSWESSCLDDLSGQEIERRLEESAKIVEMDTGRVKSSSNKRNGSISECSSLEQSISTNQFSAPYPLYSSAVQSLQLPTRSPPQIEGRLTSPIVVSPSQSECVTASALQDLSPRTFSGQFGNVEDCTFSTAESSPQYFSAVSKAQGIRGPFTPSRPEYMENFLQDYSSFPNYMANTESSKAKVRSQSAPKQRPDYYSEKQSLLAKKRSSMPGAVENRSNSYGVRMQRSSSHVGTTCKGYAYASSIQLDKSTMSLRDSECDTASMYNANYRRSLENAEHQRRPCSSRRC